MDDYTIDSVRPLGVPTAFRQQLGYGKARSQKVALVSAYFIENGKTSAGLQDCSAL